MEKLNIKDKHSKFKRLSTWFESIGGDYVWRNWVRWFLLLTAIVLIPSVIAGIYFSNGVIVLIPMLTMFIGVLPYMVVELFKI